MLTPVMTRTIASPSEQAMPIERAAIIEFREMAPPVTSSTCLLRTWTAGSAATTKNPISIAIGMITQL